MDRHEPVQSGTEAMLKQLHERPQLPLADWLQAPAHVHYEAFRMADPPAQRAQSREEFISMLNAFEVPADARMLRDTFGYGVKGTNDRERLIVVWQAHTEYYNYQIWHVSGSSHLGFGPLTFPGYKFPVTPLGTDVCHLDILVSAEPLQSRDRIRSLLPGPVLYGSRIFDDKTTVITSFTPDEQGRERYWVSVDQSHAQASRLKDIVDAIVRIETYYHLLLMQKPLFSAAIDQVYKFEQVHLKQREVISGHIGHADPRTLQRWLNSLTQDLLKTNRIAGKLHFELSASLPYDKIVHATLNSLTEGPLDSYRPVSDYVLGGITGVADGYQQLLRRIETLRAGFEGIISIIRARVDLILEGQNLELLQSVDRTTNSQVILQHTVEGLSVIVIAYYLAGLAGYILKGLHEAGWIKNSNIALAVFVPMAIGLAFVITTASKKYLHKKLSGENAAEDKKEEH